MPALAVGGKGKAGADVFRREFRELLGYFGFGHSGGEIVKHIIDCDTGVTDARLTRAPYRIDCDKV
jgi:hypothetical protein